VQSVFRDGVAALPIYRWDSGAAAEQRPPGPLLRAAAWYARHGWLPLVATVLFAALEVGVRHALVSASGDAFAVSGYYAEALLRLTSGLTLFAGISVIPVAVTLWHGSRFRPALFAGLSIIPISAVVVLVSLIHWIYDPYRQPLATIRGNRVGFVALSRRPAALSGSRSALFVAPSAWSFRWRIAARSELGPGVFELKHWEFAEPEPPAPRERVELRLSGDEELVAIQRGERVTDLIDLRHRWRIPLWTSRKQGLHWIDPRERSAREAAFERAVKGFFQRHAQPRRPADEERMTDAELRAAFEPLGLGLPKIERGEPPTHLKAWLSTGRFLRAVEDRGVIVVCEVAGSEIRPALADRAEEWFAVTLVPGVPEQQNPPLPADAMGPATSPASTSPAGTSSPGGT
jgi:hypothetical protein